MVVLAVERSELGIEVHADAGEDAAQVVQDLLREVAVPRLVNKDLMHIHQEYTVPAVSNIVVRSMDR
jgi:hypothetical protein